MLAVVLAALTLTVGIFVGACCANSIAYDMVSAAMSVLGGLVGAIVAGFALSVVAILVSGALVSPEYEEVARGNIYSMSAMKSAYKIDTIDQEGNLTQHRPSRNRVSFAVDEQADASVLVIERAWDPLFFTTTEHYRVIMPAGSEIPSSDEGGR